MTGRERGAHDRERKVERMTGRERGVHDREREEECMTRREREAHDREREEEPMTGRERRTAWQGVIDKTCQFQLGYGSNFGVHATH